MRVCGGKGKRREKTKKEREDFVRGLVFVCVVVVLGFLDLSHRQKTEDRGVFLRFLEEDGSLSKTIKPLSHKNPKNERTGHTLTHTESREREKGKRDKDQREKEATNQKLPKKERIERERKRKKEREGNP